MLFLAPQIRRAAFVRYGVAILSVAAAFLVRYLCDPQLGSRSAQDFFLAATAVSAWYGGAGPSALSILLGTLLAQWFFAAPRHTLMVRDLADILEVASFIFSGSAIAWLSCAMKRATGAAKSSADEALREVEERRRLAKELQTLNEHLEDMVDRRTVDLRHALKELENYAYSIAHNLRAPLRGMAGLSELLLEDERENLSYEGRKHLARIMGATQQMDELILGLLDYSRVSRGEFSLGTVAMADAVGEAIRSRQEDLRSHHAQVSVDGPLPDILGHREAIVQVLSQLLSNAAKFVAPGITPRIRIRAERNGERVRLWVEDNGIGIDPQYHDRVFGVFERLHKQEDYPGTGIGLAIVRKCMERMGGQAAVESEIGKGSRFWIEAPAAAPR
ncbi:MAG TPA: ATP-binding protein [Planctomycetota bacterium]|nr:ATP-binding protein [Planctomycetota bacterium]